jgi:hypothetical protein
MKKDNVNAVELIKQAELEIEENEGFFISICGNSDGSNTHFSLMGQEYKLQQALCFFANKTPELKRILFDVVDELEI